MATGLKVEMLRQSAFSTLPKSLRHLSSCLPHPSPAPALIEVESKFHPSPYLKKVLGVSPPSRPTLASLLFGPKVCPFLSFEAQTGRLIKDQYYDFDNRLSSQGIWLRYRMSRSVTEKVTNMDWRDLPPTDDPSALARWEAKVKIGGDYHDSAFTEVGGGDAVFSMLQSRFDFDLEKLRMMAWLNTYRSSWRIANKVQPQQHIDIPSHPITDESFIMVIDHAEQDLSHLSDRGASHSNPFHHEVGEIELTATLSTNGLNDEEVVEAKAKKAGEMRMRIKGFMMRYPALFPPGDEKVDGKLSAYLAWKGEDRQRGCFGEG
ncbi:hypothetical protein LTR86_010077 [Recurvomyces mirabilis]|nr:hypothetical protein LTR86_010077 [Recurvomyces mirabilis]